MQIAPYDPHRHLAQVVAILLEIRATGGGTYPPSYVAGTTAGVTEWLQRYPARNRWVALGEDAQVLGHVQLDELDRTDPDLKQFLGSGRHPVTAPDVVEVARLFVAPAQHRRGIGGRLLAHATAHAHQMGLRCALTVLVTQHAALSLYRSAGWVDLGGFVGVSGVQNRVLLAPLPTPAR